MKRVSNNDVAETLRGVGEYLAMGNANPFRIRAYERAADAIEGLEEELASVYEQGGDEALDEIPGIGTSIAAHIKELLRTGKLREYEALKRKTPVRLDELSRVEGLGPKSVKKLYEALKVRTMDDLERVARKGAIRGVPGFGAKAEANILRSIEFSKKFKGRFLLSAITPVARDIESRIAALPGVRICTVGGSFRRKKETVGDLDVVVVAERSKPVMDYFVRMPEVARVFAHGETKSAVKLKSGLDVDLRIVKRESYGAALNYFTGSKEHNVALRQIAIKKGLKLNEYGLFKGARRIAGGSEAELYRALGLAYIEPELREHTGEIQAAASSRGGLPRLVGYDDIKGDLQTQTEWTDGAASIVDMAKAAMRQGLSYMAVTDHTKNLAMTHGLDEKRILSQMKEIDRVNVSLRGKFAVLKGSECDILKDGSMDLPDKVLTKLDVVGGSVHSYFNLDRRAQTARIIRAMENPHVDIIFHPTGRLIGRREPYAVDMDALIRAAKRTGTILEVDAFPDRLDLKDEYIKQCVEAGVKMAIDSDAHALEHFKVLEYGIAQARRGWATASDIVNTRSLVAMRKLLK